MGVDLEGQLATGHREYGHLHLQVVAADEHWLIEVDNYAAVGFHIALTADDGVVGAAQGYGRGAAELLVGADDDDRVKVELLTAGGVLHTHVDSRAEMLEEYGRSAFAGTTHHGQTDNLAAATEARCIPMREYYRRAVGVLVGGTCGGDDARRIVAADGSGKALDADGTRCAAADLHGARLAVDAHGVAIDPVHLVADHRRLHAVQYKSLCGEHYTARHIILAAACHHDKAAEKYHN